MGDLYRQGLANLPPDNLSPALFEILGAADAFDAMLRGAIVGYAVAVMATIRRIGRSKLVTTTWKAMWVVCGALLVLIFAWMLGSAITACGASAYLQTLLTGNMPPELLPAATFLLAAIIAFSTGTSWGTMSILFPIALPLAITMTGDVGAVTLATTSAILAGACFGDHASPISDTTILSALGAEVDLITHVRTQLPYALTTGTIALFLGYLPAGYGVSPWILIPIGAFAAWVVMRTFGKKPLGAQMREPVDERVG
jgi:Na+/H+ antiporter NhaC